VLRSRRPLERPEVLGAAADVAFESGLHAVSAASVAARLDVRRGAVAALVADEDELVAATFAHMVGDELVETERAVLARTSPLEQLTVLIRTLAEPVGDLDAVWRESWSLGRRNAALGAAVRAKEDAWHRLIADVVRRGVASGDFADVDAAEVATHLLAAMNGVNAYSLVGYEGHIDRLRLLHAVARGHLGVTPSGDATPLPAG
jgi:AcrR family transcriptional regulator